MALTPETGEGLADADSYASVADADAYHAKRGNAAWAALTTEQKEQALVRATDYMRQAYRGKWLGMKLLISQALDWPRVGVFVDGYEEDALPVEIVQACIELALRASGSALIADEGRKTTREKVDVIEVEYSEFGSAQTKYAAVDALLRPLMGGIAGGVNFRVVRA